MCTIRIISRIATISLMFIVWLGFLWWFDCFTIDRLIFNDFTFVFLGIPTCVGTVW